MTISTPYQFYLDSLIDVQELQNFLSTKYTLRVSQRDFEDARVLDTFDRELRSSGRLLLSDQNGLTLFKARSPEMCSQPLSANWRFHQDLSDGSVAASLQDISELRAFLPLYDFEWQLQEFVVLDDEEKTQARAWIYTIRKDEQTRCFGATQTLKGYVKGHRRLVGALQEQGAHARENAFDFYAFLGVPESAYTSRPKVPIVPNASVLDTTRAIITAYIQVARANEAGVQADYDTEFLHDYRVSLRKVRSVLSLFKGVFAEEDTIRLKRAFAEIMQQTNRLRDLDVYLLDKALYFSMVPDSLHEGLQEMFASFAKERWQQLKQVNEMLQSEDYQGRMTELSELFEEPDRLEFGPLSSETSREFACQKIWKRYKKVCKIARSITAETPDEIVHDLRIHCKKLRYLMEFFSPVFPKKEMKRLIRALKRLQDNLGRFNDFSVQQLSLQDFLHQHSEQQNLKLKLAESIGSLVTVLHQRQLEERRHVMENVAHFDSTEIRTAFYTLFAQEKS